MSSGSSCRKGRGHRPPWSRANALASMSDMMRMPVPRTNACWVLRRLKLPTFLGPEPFPQVLPHGVMNLGCFLELLARDAALLGRIRFDEAAVY